MKTFQNRKWDTDPTLIYKGGCPSVPTADVPTPQDMPQPIRPTCRIALGQAASDALRETQCDYLVTSPQAYPDDPARYAIYCYCLPPEITRQISAILRGTHHAIRNRPAKASATNVHP